jgi:hypothetical protein
MRTSFVAGLRLSPIIACALAAAGAFAQESPASTQTFAPSDPPVTAQPTPQTSAALAQAAATGSDTGLTVAYDSGDAGGRLPTRLLIDRSRPRPCRSERFDPFPIADILEAVHRRTMTDFLAGLIGSFLPWRALLGAVAVIAMIIAAAMIWPS